MCAVLLFLEQLLPSLEWRRERMRNRRESACTRIGLSYWSTRWWLSYMRCTGEPSQVYTLILVQQLHSYGLVCWLWDLDSMLVDCLNSWWWWVITIHMLVLHPLFSFSHPSSTRLLIWLRERWTVLFTFQSGLLKWIPSQNYWSLSKIRSTRYWMRENMVWITEC